VIRLRRAGAQLQARRATAAGFPPGQIKFQSSRRFGEIAEKARPAADEPAAAPINYQARKANV
jgi:hypothetical protein